MTPDQIAELMADIEKKPYPGRKRIRTPVLPQVGKARYPGMRVHLRYFP